MRVVVTGAAGFIASHVCERLLDRGDSVLGIDALADSYDPALKRPNCAGLLTDPDFQLLDRDVNQDGLAAVLNGADAVCHFAGCPGVLSTDEEALESSNVRTTEAVMKAAERAEVPRVVLASSSSVYAPARRPVDESAPLKPISAYGRSKRRAERRGAAMAERQATTLVVLRFFTVYGPRQRPDMAFAQYLARARQGKPMRIRGDGNQRRDFTYVGDAAEATLLALEPGVRGVFNVSGGCPVTLVHALELLAENLGEQAPRPSFGPSDPREHRSTEADLTRARHELGYEPSVTLHEGIAEQIAAEALRLVALPAISGE